MRRPAFLIVCCGVVLSMLHACGRAPEPVKTPTPAAYYPEQFADVPLPPGYRRRPGVDQVAIAFANDRLRHMDITLEESGATESKSGPELLSWYRTVLISNGWKPHANKLLPRSALQFTKLNHGHQELLELRTGREKKLGIIRLRFLNQDEH